MKPDYTEVLFEKMGKQEGGVLSTGVSGALRELVDTISKVEGVRPSRLVFEGLARVIEDRYTDIDGQSYRDALGEVGIALELLQVFDE